MSKTMTSKLPNAVSHVSSWSLDVFLHPYKDWRFLLNFKRKSDIFANSMEYQKIMNIDKYVTFDLGWLYTWLTRRWKAPNLQFSKNFFWVPFGYITFWVWFGRHSYVYLCNWMSIIGDDLVNIASDLMIWAYAHLYEFI